MGELVFHFYKTNLYLKRRYNNFYFSGSKLSGDHNVMVVDGRWYVSSISQKAYLNKKKSNELAVSGGFAIMS